MAEIYRIGYQKAEEYIEHITCGWKSFNRNDIENKYCANCHIFMDQEEQIEHTLLTDRESGNFVTIFHTLSSIIHQNAIKKGFWDYSKLPGIPKEVVILTKLALIQAEVGEAVEAARERDPKPDKDLKIFPNLTVELADTIIRIMDLASFYDMDLPEALLTKVGYNMSRKYLHGKKI